MFAWDWEKFSASGEKVDEARDTLVTVEFEPRGIFTEVILTHEGLATAAQREAHSKGWNGCFDRLEEEWVGCLGDHADLRSGNAQPCDEVAPSVLAHGDDPLGPQVHWRDDL